MHENSPGAAHARNHGVRACTGEYITFIDCDDYFEPQKIAIDLEILLREKLFSKKPTVSATDLLLKCLFN